MLTVSREELYESCTQGYEPRQEEDDPDYAAYTGEASRDFEGVFPLLVDLVEEVEERDEAHEDGEDDQIDDEWRDSHAPIIWSGDMRVWPAVSSQTM